MEEEIVWIPITELHERNRRRLRNLKGVRLPTARRVEGMTYLAAPRSFAEQRNLTTVDLEIFS